jgi:hypothetical protein
MRRIQKNSIRDLAIRNNYLRLSVVQAVMHPVLQGDILPESIYKCIPELMYKVDSSYQGLKKVHYNSSFSCATNCLR